MACNNLFSNFTELPVWQVTPTHFICTDEKTGKILENILRPVDENGNAIPAMTLIKVWVSKELVIDSVCCEKVYSQTKSLPTRSKRILPIGAELMVKLSPAMTFFTQTPKEYFRVRTDHPGQENLLDGAALMNFLSFTPISPVPAKKPKV